ncbi:uncharacterized protein TrAtP1_002635 [Trichoderma atroviride]|nr:hypothetical protein TrAtP1_002635 [Trichoderma atroviride]
MIMRRSHSPTETQVYLTLRDDSKELQNMPRASVEKQKEFWTERFRDAGWETARFLQGLKTAENFYCQHVVQVRTDTWYKGRVVLVGDAAYCPSPFSGMGTTGSFVGAYVLAGEINRSPSDLNSAFANYNKTLRPFVNEIQKVSQFFVRFGLPETQFGASFNLFLAQMVSVFRIPDFIAKYTTEENSGWKLPDY